MSDPLSSISWRLNELLKAGKKARAFAKSPWGLSKASSDTPPFSPMQPRSLDALPEGARETESLDLHEEEETELQEEVLADETREPDEVPQPELPQYSEEAMEQAKQEADAEGYQRGLAEGNDQWREAREAFLALVDMFRSAQANTDDFYAPLKQLSLHLAEELVRGELTLSSTAVERLVKEVLKDIEQQGEGPIVIYLNPVDLEQFTLKLDDQQGNIDLRADQQLSRGSIKINMDDSAVEDLIENRLQALTDSLLGLGSQASSEGAGEYKFANPVEEKIIEDVQITEQANSEPELEKDALAQQSNDSEIDSEDKNNDSNEEEGGADSEQLIDTPPPQSE